ncbi:MAG: M3 family metallopeptidase [Porphyromonadaceae bacterium]|nr:M3 family metallopeptidase [Porphyromonadaceae bacterium]
MKKLILTLSLAAMLTACNGGGASSSSPTNNPLLKGSSLEFGAPEFDKIKPEHFIPAFEVGMRQQLEEVERIATSSEAPTFTNTLVALQQTGQLLDRTASIFFGLASAHATDEIRQIEEEIAPKLAAHHDAISLNEQLFQRIKTVYENERVNLLGEDLRLLDIVYGDFVKQGASLDAASKEQLKKINAELSVLTNKFSNLVKDGSAAAALVVDNLEELDGLSEEHIAQARAAAKSRGLEGKYVLEIQNTTRSAFLPELNNRELRRKLLEASMQRGERGDEYDTRQVVLDITRLRAEKAQLLGFDNYASWTLRDQMAGKPEYVYSFIHRLADAYRLKAEADARELERFAQETAGMNFKLEAWDWDYYAEKLRKAKYDLDENDIKPYFVLDSVVKNGLFFMAERLYGVTFQERHDLPVYTDGVHVYDMYDADGEKLALFYTDYYRRPTKSGGAWMSNWSEQSTLLGKKPVVYNVCNYTRGVDGAPTLLTMDEVTTLFHEFGHGLHGLFANQRYAKLSGTSVARDFVEMPSQFHEHWATHPEVLASYAKHYKTGEAMPASLVEKMKQAAQFNQAYALGENLAAVIVDMAWHGRSAGSEVTDVAKFEQEALAQTGILNRQIPPRYRSTYFRHSMGGGYSAGYYAYLWAEVLDNNAYDWFSEHGGLTRENGDRLRQTILSQGNSQDLNKIFEDMTGLKEPKIESLMKARGLQ